MELKGTVALVTGAARRVGRTIAMALAEAGADLALHYHRSADEARQAAEEIRSRGRRAELFQADLARPERIGAMFEAVAKVFGRLDVLVNNASVFHRTPLAGLTAEQWDAELAVNARAPALCIRHAVALMGDGGAIVNIADIAAEKPWAGFTAYCASKAALLAVTRSAAKALAARKIRVNSVAPGVALWPEGAGEARKQQQEQEEKVLAQIPMRRSGSPGDVAAAVIFLIQNDYITGQNIRVDGGRHMG